jgi:predicted ATPase
MIVYGLCGAHRTGKTTLCKELERVGFTPIEMNLSHAQAQLGYNSANQTYPWETRQKIQEGLLKYMAETIDRILTKMSPFRRKTSYIFDRTPLDLIGYAMLAFPPNATEADHAWMQWYITHCVRITNKHFDKVYLLQPGIPLVHSPTSGPLDTSMIEQLNQTYLAQFLSPDVTIPKFVFPREATDLMVRAKLIKQDELNE